MSEMSEAEGNVSVTNDNDLPHENPQPAHLERNETSTETSSTSKTRSGRLVKKPDRLGIYGIFIGEKKLSEKRRCWTFTTDITVDFTKLWPRQLRGWLGIWEP
jgi:hypothetical protein